MKLERDNFGLYYDKDEQPEYLNRLANEEKYVNQLIDDENMTAGISTCNLELINSLRPKMSENEARNYIRTIMDEMDARARSSGEKKTYEYDLGYNDYTYVTVFNNGMVKVRDSGTGCSFWYEKSKSQLAFEYARGKKERHKALNRMFGA